MGRIQTPEPGGSGPSVQFTSVAQSCTTLCDPVNHSTPGLPVHHQLPEFTQTHVHQVSDAIQLSHPLLPTLCSGLNVPVLLFLKLRAMKEKTDRFDDMETR